MFPIANLNQTSQPVQSKTQQSPDDVSLNTFHGYYNFHFASIDCIAWGETCEKLGVKGFPSFFLYKNGEFVEKYTGHKSIEGLSEYVEEKLEQIKPGSRSKDGVKLPAIGADHVDVTAAPDVPASKDKDTAAGVAAGEKHNEQAAQLATKSVAAVEPLETTLPKATSKAAAAKPKVTPNPQGKSVELTAESFQSLVTTTQEPWFIKFYAPWCPHCQALAPVWAQMAKDMVGELNVGEVNCDVEVRLCKDVRVRGYPTIHYFKAGERVEYTGMRGLGDIVSYAKKAVDSAIEYVNATSFKAMEETEEVIFLYFYDHATTSEDFEALERLTLSLIGRAKLVKTDDPALADRFKISTWPRLLVSRDGRPSYYTALAPKDMRDFRRVLTWMQTVWQPLVPELTAQNAREIMDGRFVVLGILTRDRPDDFEQGKRELKNAALEWMDKVTQAFQLERQELRDSKQLRIEEADDRNDQRSLRSAKSIRINIQEDDKKQVSFAWVDGVFWERWVRTTFGFDVKDGERVIIHDEDVRTNNHTIFDDMILTVAQNRRYWDQTETGNYIMPSRTSILETLPRIVSNPPRLAPKSTIGFFESIYFNIRSFTSGHPWISVILVVICLVVSATWGKNKIRRSRGSLGGHSLPGGNNNGGFFKLDGKEGFLSSFGGNTASGKVD